MNILEIKVMRGPNYWSVQRHRLIVMVLDLQDLEQKPTHKIPGFYQRLVQLIPSLETHLCSEGVPGGFLNRVKNGTWMGHVVEHIALEIQSLAGMDTCFGRAVETDKKGVYHIVFSYVEERAGRLAAQYAVDIAHALVLGLGYNLPAAVGGLRQAAGEDFIGPSTNAIVQEADRRYIPHIRLDDDCYVQLGYGCRQKRIQATIASTTSNIAVELASDKEAVKRILADAEIPVPEGVIVTGETTLQAAIDTLGYPLAIKPVDGNHGNGATTNINTVAEALAAFATARHYGEKVICERFIAGYDFRALVINYRFVAAARRTPAAVTGDGIHTIAALADLANHDPRRGKGHQNVLTLINLDDASVAYLARQGYTPATIPADGEECLLKPTANLSTGGTATDVTDTVHPANIALFERIARLIGLDICGIDIIATTLATPAATNGGAVLEVNAAPGFRMHLEPTHGKPRNVAAPVIDMLFPNGNNGSIPIVAVTGTNGKTTTTRLTAHIARLAGNVTGYTTTDGIYINSDLLTRGDCSGPNSARTILKDPSVEFAVLETARGGILRSGLAFPYCHAAVITNVAEDHLGLDGIDTLEKLAHVKAVVAEAVLPSGYAILNADDNLVYGMKDRVKSKVALFSLYENNVRIKRHTAGGGLAAVYADDYIYILQGNKRIRIERVANIPITFDGRAEFNIANALGATLAAFVSNINLDDIRAGLQSFIPSADTTPGRMNIFNFTGFSVMVDYAHNPHGMHALGKFMRTVTATTRVGIIAGVGDRRDDDLQNIGEEAAKVFDEIIIRPDKDLRGRTADEIFNLVTAGIRRHDAQKHIRLSDSEQAALELAVAQARPGAFIVILTDDVAQVLAKVRLLQQKDATTRLLTAARS